jgi:hypothetical protein
MESRSGPGTVLYRGRRQSSARCAASGGTCQFARPPGGRLAFSMRLVLLRDGHDELVSSRCQPAKPGARTSYDRFRARPWALTGATLELVIEGLIETTMRRTGARPSLSRDT